MIQLVSYGIAALLIVKALDVIHRDAVAARSGNASPKLAAVVALVAALSAIVLVAMGRLLVGDIRDQSFIPMTSVL